MMFEIGKVQEMLVILVALAVTVFEIAMVVHILRNRKGFLIKLLWVAIIIAAPILGALYYFYWADLYRRRKHSTGA